MGDPSAAGSHSPRLHHLAPPCLSFPVWCLSFPSPQWGPYLGRCPRARRAPPLPTEPWCSCGAGGTRGSLHPGLGGEGLLQQLCTFPRTVPLPRDQMFSPSSPRQGPGHSQLAAAVPGRTPLAAVPPPASHLRGGWGQGISGLVPSAPQWHPSWAVTTQTQWGAEPGWGSSVLRVRGLVCWDRSLSPGLCVWGMLEHLLGMLECLGWGFWSVGGRVAGAFREMLKHLGGNWSI